MLLLKQKVCLPSKKKKKLEYCELLLISSPVGENYVHFDYIR